MRIFFFNIALIILLDIPSIPISAQDIPSPKDYFGFNIGDDYQLINYKQAVSYFKKLSSISDRVKLEDIGPTEEGRRMYLAIISSPKNLKELDHIKQISQNMARAEGLSEKEAEKLSFEGKPIVWIDGGLHATETEPAQAIVQLYYELLSRNDKETKRILDNVIILLCEVNPDGMDMVSDWYMRKGTPKLRSYHDLPFLYNKYVGHDNNRDFYMMNMKETKNISRQLFIEWMPQIVFDQHQSAPRGSIVAGPPFRGPFNYVYDPLVLSGIDELGSAMINRLNAENKPGYTRLRGASFNTWWNGGLRSINYFHNMIGLLTETRGYPTPSKIEVKPDRLIPDNNTPNPIPPQKTWHLSQALEYTISIDYAILDYASRNGDKLLKNIYTMGKNSIRRGNKDHWTYNPLWKDHLKEVYRKGNPYKKYEEIFRDPEKRDPRGYIIQSNQKDFGTTIRFVNALINSGIKVYKSASSFQVEGTTYPAGSYIIKTNQAFRPFILDMFEPQHYPNDFKYPGGPPIRPYDATGWTLAYQMGVKFDRILEEFKGPFKQIPYGKLQISPIQHLEESSGGYLLSSAANDSYKIVNTLLKENISVYRITNKINGMPKGSFYIPSNGYKILNAESTHLKIDAKPISRKPTQAVKISPARIALYDKYGGYASSGWVRWILDQFHFKFNLIYPKELNKGNLLTKYDVILFIDYGIPPVGGKTVSKSKIEEDNIPLKYRYMVGTVSIAKTIPAIKGFIEKGGKVVTVGRNTRLAYHLGLPVNNALKEINGEEKRVNVSNNRYYVPTSILQVNLNTNASVNWGMQDKTFVMFNNNPVFNIAPGSKKIKPLAWFGQENPLASGWVWGAPFLKNGIVAFKASIGDGSFYAFSPEITFRAQSWNTFKILFNELYLIKAMF